MDSDLRPRIADLPPGRTRFMGRPRRLGLELEFGGVRPDQAAALVARQLGGDVVRVSEFEYLVEGTALGEFRIEVDLALLRRLGRELTESGADENELLRWSADLLGAVVRSVVPVEVVTPPFDARRLGELEPVVEALRAAGAEGTTKAVVYAFGVHLNPEVPEVSAPCVLSYLRAFLCLYDWLKSRSQVDLSRKLTPFINRFPQSYELLVLAPDYAPDLETFTDDYLRHNPTRNRALDLLPLLAWHDEARVRAVLPDEKINPRPTFHYRLPNCDIDRPGWQATRAWDDWLQVEFLAANALRLAEICAARRADFERWTRMLDDRWLQRSREWLIDL